MYCWKFACEGVLERFVYFLLAPVPRFWFLHFQLVNIYPANM